MSDDVKVEVRGLRQLNGALKRVDAETGKKLKEEFRGLAERVASKVRGMVPSGPSGKAAASVKGRGTTRGASIAFGGSKAEYYPWLDFGGSTGRGHKPRVAWSGAIKRTWLGKPGGDGRYVYPTIKDEAGNIKKDVDQILARVARGAGFDQKGNG